MVCPDACVDGIHSQDWQMNTRFNYSQAIAWQIKFIISSFLTKKTANAASVELAFVSLLEIATDRSVVSFEI